MSISKKLLLVSAFLFGATYNLMTFWAFGFDFERGEKLASVFLTAPLCGAASVLIVLLILKDYK